MKKSVIIFIFTIFFLLIPAGIVFSQRGSAAAEVVNIRIASPLPQNSEWGRALNRLAADWERVTSNQVRVVVNHDGREGGETDMLRKLNSNSIQVGIFTSSGISEICPAVMNLSVPFMIKNENELDRVLRDVLPVLESRVRNDYVVLSWSKGGWVYLFSKETVFTPDDLRRQKLATSPELSDMNAIFRTMGFQLVEADFVNIGTRLASNMVNSLYLIPAAVAPMQLHRSLNHMLDLPIAPIMGAIVMNRVTWNRLSSAHQQDLIRITRQMAVEFDASMSRTEATAISAMGRDGLSVNKANQAQEELWRSELQRIMPTLVGTIFDRDLYNRINDILDRTRSGR